MSKKVKKNIPKLRFPQFQDDWRGYKFSELFSISAGGDIDTNKVRTEPDEVYKYPVYANAEKDKGLYGYSNEYKIEPNVITVAGRGVNIGIAHARDHHFYPIVRLLVLKPKAVLNIYFFEYQINRINVFVESTGVPQLTAPQISSYRIFSTSIAEQEKIASFLGAVDRRLTQLRRKQELLQTYKRGVMQKIFSQEIRFKGAIGSPYPDWQKKKLGELGTFLGGGTPSTSQKNYWTGKIPWISSSDLEEDSIYKISITRFINETAIKESATKRVPPNSILIISRVGVGKIAVSKQELCTSQDFSNFTPYQGNVYFIAYLLMFQKNKLLSISQGTSIKGFTNYDLSLLKIDFPCIEEQGKIVDFLRVIDQKIEAVSFHIEKIKQFKKGMLQKMFV